MMAFHRSFAAVLLGLLVATAALPLASAAHVTRDPVYCLRHAFVPAIDTEKPDPVAYAQGTVQAVRSLLFCMGHH